MCQCSLNGFVVIYYGIAYLVYWCEHRRLTVYFKLPKGGD